MSGWRQDMGSDPLLSVLRMLNAIDCVAAITARRAGRNSYQFKQNSCWLDI